MFDTLHCDRYCLCLRHKNVILQIESSQIYRAKTFYVDHLSSSEKKSGFLLTS